ncbi:FliH/SctL family protein [Arthrobacter antioxidans]|uniref:FliH/SctL family protein n=1 Tax=Arthrobacter antioxidans TaxID=2895818 RepID=UPI001FFFDA2F|nr:FliH/SctL family protein [Arthrobacter antioxidans]
MSTDAFTPVAFPRLGPGQASHHAAVAQGHAAGYADGLALARAELAERRAQLDAEHAAARAQADAVLAQRLRVLDTAARAFDARTAPVLDEARTRILDAAVHITEALLGRALEDGPSSARAAVARALRGAEGEEVRAVRLHPADLAVLAPDDTPTAVHLVPDATLQRGDAVAECPDGHVDARLGSALARVRSALAAGGAA